MTAVDAIARVAQLQSDLQRLSGASGAAAANETSGGADAFAALLGSVTAGGTDAATPVSALGSTDDDAPKQGGAVTGDAIVHAAEQYLGVPYVFGGESTSGGSVRGDATTTTP